MNLYEPLQHLSFYLTDNNGKEKRYLKSTVNILADAGETFFQVLDSGNPFVIIYRAISDQKNLEKNVFSNTVFIDLDKAGGTSPYSVKVIVYKMNGDEGGQVTTTISDNAEIKD